MEKDNVRFLRKKMSLATLKDELGDQYLVAFYDEKKDDHFMFFSPELGLKDVLYFRALIEKKVFEKMQMRTF
jgi:hypothetical protein